MIALNSDTLRFTGVTLTNPHHVVIPDGVTAIIGPNGSGKSTLGKILEGGWNFMTNDISGHRVGSDAEAKDRKLRIKIIEFSDIHALTGFKSAYYQQRFESGMNLETPTVAELLGDRINTELWQRLTRELRMGDITDKRANCLSSGELRKLLIANMMFDLPDVLILDNPFIGLDAHSRPVLNDTITAIAASGVSVILLICNDNEIPTGATVIRMADSSIQKPELTEKITESKRGLASPPDPKPAVVPTEHASYPIVEMHDVTVRYGDRIILSNVDWTIRRGECWSLSGPNGCGKSTLLSLINADNPQGYCNDISLFGRRRGTGESIWDIKHRIAYVSPEMHLYFQGYNNTLSDVVAAGLNDTVGFYQRITPEQTAQALKWLERLGISHLADRRFSILSYGEQRLGLLARTFIKNAELMILDEPLHGLDSDHKRLIINLIDEHVRQHGTTLIYVTHYVPEIPACVTLHKRLG